MSVIHLLNSSATTLLDSVAADYEDSFSLEQFAALAEEHEQAEPCFTKHFIIARVRTWDPRNPGKEYFSYYSAYGLNKILFQTQSYLGRRLIHRIHVLNPLTNTDIIGAVEYFIVRRRQPSNEVAGNTFNPNWGIITTTKTITTRTNAKYPATKSSASSVKDQKSKDEGVKSRSRRASATSLPSKMGLKVLTSFTASKQLSIPPPSPSVKRAEAGNENWTLGDQVVSELNEDDVAYTGYLKRRGKPVNHTTSSSSSPTRASTSPLILSSGASNPLKISIPNGQVTRFAAPVSASVLEAERTQLSRIPSNDMSFGNSVIMSPSLTLNEWRTSDRQRQRSASTVTDHPPKLGSPMTPTLSEAKVRKTLANSALYKNIDKIASLNESMPAAVLASCEEDAVWEAVLFATDIDYLEKSSIRQIFKENAVSTADYKHFEMQPVTKEVGDDEDLGPNGRVVLMVPNSNNIRHRDRIIAWCYPTREEVAGLGPTEAFIHRTKCYFIPLFILFGITIVIIVMAVNTVNRHESKVNE